MSAQMWFQFSPLLGKSLMLIANMPRPHWTVSTTQKTGGKRTCLLFFHKQLQIDHNNVLGCRKTGNMCTSKPSSLPHCLWWGSAMQTNSHSAVLFKSYILSCRALTPMKPGTDDFWDRTDQSRLGLFSPETIQQHETPFTRIMNHLRQLDRDTIKAWWKYGKRTTTQELVGERRTKKTIWLFKTIHLIMNIMFCIIWLCLRCQDQQLIYGLMG